MRYRGCLHIRKQVLSRYLCRNTEPCWNGSMTDAERIDKLDARVDKLAASVHEYIQENNRIIKESGTRFDQMTARMDQTDKRWNELIDMLNREHGNGKPPLSP